jgi:hypothetical protein
LAPIDDGFADPKADRDERREDSIERSPHARQGISWPPT